MRLRKGFLTGGRTVTRPIVVVLSIVCVVVATGIVPAAAVTWTVVPSPDAGGGDNPIGVAATSTSDAWIVGDRFDPTTSTYPTLIEHWNGTAWSVIPSPNGGKFNWLYGAAAISSKDAWAVGFANNSSWARNKPLAEHWDGTRWTIVPTPNRDFASEFLGVAAVSSTNVWAVGDSTTSTGDRKTLVEHWDGSRWSIVVSPNASSYNGLVGVAADPAGGLWAVGNVDSHTLIERYAGGSWSIVPSPNPNTTNYLDRVAAVGSSDVWAVGLDYNDQYVYQSLIEHWDGTRWSVVAAPNIGAELRSVAAVSSSDVWAVGTNGNRTLIEHWDGRAWSVAPSPNVGSGFNSLEGIGGVGTTLWAAGTYDTPTGSRTLILRTDQA
jgi:hypothetical protein